MLWALESKEEFLKWAEMCKRTQTSIVCKIEMQYNYMHVWVFFTLANKVIANIYQLVQLRKQTHHYIWQIVNLNTSFRLTSTNLFCFCFLHIRFVFWTVKKKKTYMKRFFFLLIGSKLHLKLVWSAIPIGFLQMHLSPDGLDTQMGFQSVF